MTLAVLSNRARALTRVAAVSSLFVAMTATGLAQQVPVPGEEPSPNEPTGSATRTVVGHFHSPYDPDVLVLLDGQPQLHYGPGAFSGTYPTGTTARDIATAVGRAPEGLDAYVRIHDDGLVLGWFVPGATGAPFAESGLATGVWTTATRVLVPRDSSVTFVGVAAGNGSVLIFDEMSGLTDVLPVPGIILDLVLADWTHDGIDDVISILDTGVYAMTRSGLPLLFEEAQYEGAFATRITQAGFPYDRVTFAATPTGSGAQQLTTADPTGVETPINLASFTTHGLCAGDLDLDGNDDLVLMHRKQVMPPGHYPMRFFNQKTLPEDPVTFSFGSSSRWDIEIGSSPGLNQQAWPVLADFCRDGDADVALYVEALEGLSVTNNSHFRHTDHALDPTLVDGFWNDYTGNLDITVDIAQPAAQLAGATHLAITHWDASFTAGMTTIETVPTGVAQDYILLPADWSGAYVKLWFWDGSGLRWLQFSLARLDEMGEVEAVGPISSFAMTFQEPEIDELLGVYPDGEWFDILYVGDDPPGDGEPLTAGPGFGGSRVRTPRATPARAERGAGDPGNGAPGGTPPGTPTTPIDPSPNPSGGNPPDDQDPIGTGGGPPGGVKNPGGSVTGGGLTTPPEPPGFGSDGAPDGPPRVDG